MHLWSVLSSVFIYIALCITNWGTFFGRRPDELRVLWQRRNRKANSIPVCFFFAQLRPAYGELHCTLRSLLQVKWVVTEDKGPNGASGKAKFEQKLQVSLVVTLYQVRYSFERPKGKKKALLQEADVNHRVLGALYVFVNP